MKTFKQWTSTWQVKTRKRWCRITVRTIIVVIFIPMFVLALFSSIAQNVYVVWDDLQQAFEQMRFYWTEEYHDTSEEYKA